MYFFRVLSSDLTRHVLQVDPVYRFISISILTINKTSDLLKNYNNG